MPATEKYTSYNNSRSHFAVDTWYKQETQVDPTTRFRLPRPSSPEPETSGWCSGWFKARPIPVKEHSRSNSNSNLVLEVYSLPSENSAEQDSFSSPEPFRNFFREDNDSIIASEYSYEQLPGLRTKDKSSCEALPGAFTLNRDISQLDLQDPRQNIILRGDPHQRAKSIRVETIGRRVAYTPEPVPPMPTSLNMARPQGPSSSGLTETIRYTGDRGYLHPGGQTGPQSSPSPPPPPRVIRRLPIPPQNTEPQGRPRPLPPTPQTPQTRATR
ncbi:hypothetical protein QCA50_004290 [Cerrena zonata]|uniref:Uncharacterized protein n=1 Tax=Cerrena zonata TaxID=2478898 RepID=A0AAW0GL46_9APHY